MNYDNFIKINGKTNIFNFVIRLFWSILNKIKYKNIYFLDTNIVVTNKTKRDSRVLKLLPFFKKRVVSEVIYSEILEKLNKGFKKQVIFSEVISINKIKEEYPEACPLYYNLILGMNNPAVINNPNFFVEHHLYDTVKDNKRWDEKTDIQMWKKLSQKIGNATKRKINIFGEKVSDSEKLIDEAYASSIKKKRNNLKKNFNKYINDYKNISTAFVKCVFYKQNITVVTADRDILYAFMSSLDHIMQQMVFMNLILEKISNPDTLKKRIYKGEEVTININKDEFDELENGYRADILGHDWKKDSFRFVIKFWDINKKKYLKPIWINFDEKTLDLFIKSHGGISCPFVKNTDYGNWLTYKYFWPPRSNVNLKKNIIEFQIKRVKDFRYNSSSVPWVVHNAECYYSQMDQAGKLFKLSVFKEE